MIPSINDSTISFLTMINGTLVQEIGDRKILEPFAVTLYSYKILPVILEKISPARFAPCSLPHFKKKLFILFS